MFSRTLTTFFALVIAVTFLASPVFAESTDDIRRAEAKTTILIPWSKAAKTAELKMSPEATKMMDLWLDYGRNKFGGRAKPSAGFRGVPHEVWRCQDGKIFLSCNFVSLVIDSAEISINDSTSIISILSSDEFLTKIKVEGDEDTLLYIWALMLSRKIAQFTDFFVTSEQYTKFIENGGKEFDSAGQRVDIHQHLLPRHRRIWWREDIHEQFLSRPLRDLLRPPSRYGRLQTRHE